MWCLVTRLWSGPDHLLQNLYHTAPNACTRLHNLGFRTSKGLAGSFRTCSLSKAAFIRGHNLVNDNFDRVMHDSCAFVHGLPTSSSKRAIFVGLSKRSCSLKRTRTRIVARSEPPPKPGYYKNPSRAIEKGGGFYIPGLRGPRLRFLVPLVAGVFLAANHATGGASTDALSRTELLDAIAAMGLLGTALQDVLSDGKKESSKTTGENSMTEVTGEEVEMVSSSKPKPDSDEWARDIVQDLEPNVEIAHFRKAKMVFRTENVMDAAGGPAVERVMREQKGVYIARLSSLPEEVSIPFLQSEDWSVFMVPTSDEDVVVFASRDELHRDSRRWLEALSVQIPK